MSVKRYIHDRSSYKPSFMDERSDGNYVLHSDYASLLARHNALMDAVATARKQIQMICHELQKTIGGVNVPLLMEDLVEVDRLLLEEK